MKTYSRIAKKELPGMDSAMPKAPKASAPAQAPTKNLKVMKVEKVSKPLSRMAPAADPLAGYKNEMAKKGGSFGVGFGGEPSGAKPKVYKRMK